MANEFFIPVANQTGQAIGNLTQTIQGAGQVLEQRRQAEKQQQLYDEAVKERDEGIRMLDKAMQEGDYDTIASLSLKYPQMSEAALKMLGAKNERTQKDAINTLGRLYLNPENYEQILSERKNLVVGEGGDPVDTEQFIETFRNNPELARQMTEGYLALSAPDQYKQLKESQKGEQVDLQYKDGIVFNPRTGETKRASVQPTKKKTLKEVSGGVKYYTDGSEEPIGQGEQVKNPVTGKRFTPQQAQAVLADAKEFQLKNGGFAVTLDSGLNTIDRMYSEGYDPTKAAWVGAAFNDGAVSNLLRNEEDQVFMGAIDEMINAIARRETGAAITEFERKDFFNRYMPRPGDSKKRLAQKRDSLERQLKSIAGQSGGVYEALKITGDDSTLTGGQTDVGQDANVVNWGDL